MNATSKAKPSFQSVVDLIEREAREVFPNALVGRVFVDAAEDASGDDMLKISVVLGDPEAVDAEAALGFIGHLKRLLEKELCEDRFPVVSYFSRGEAAELFSEAR